MDCSEIKNKNRLVLKYEIANLLGEEISNNKNEEMKCKNYYAKDSFCFSVGCKLKYTIKYEIGDK